MRQTEICKKYTVDTVLVRRHVIRRDASEAFAGMVNIKCGQLIPK